MLSTGKVAMWVSPQGTVSGRAAPKRKWQYKCYPQEKWQCGFHLRVQCQEVLPKRGSGNINVSHPQEKREYEYKPVPYTKPVAA